VDAGAAGLVVFWGGAGGDDAAAHRGALERDGRTWAVLGNGLAEVYPPEHTRLAAEIVEKGGALASAMPLRERIHRETFKLRNRIMAGLSFGTLIVEGAHGSGARSTGDAAVEYGRELYAVPGPAGERLSELPHYFLRNGATLLESFRDIAPDLPEPYKALSSNRKTLPQLPALSRDLQKVLECIGPRGASLEELQSATGLDLPRLSTIIFELEIQQIIDSIPGQRYAKKRHFETRRH
jgi:DNA processing protein